MIIQKIQQQLSNKFIRNVGWLGGAELFNRVFRLVTTVTLTRVFSLHEYGLMAIVYTTFEFALIFSQGSGFTARIIRADEKELKTVCDTSFWLNLAICLALFLIQCLGAFPFAKFIVKDSAIILPLCILATIYLSFPFFVITHGLIERDNRLEVKALCQALQAVSSNLMIVTLALLGWGIWAIVLPIVFTTPIWIVVGWMNHSWRPPTKLKLEKLREILSFDSKLVGVELLSRLRNYIDYYLILIFLGTDALGLYFFAFNAGFGISLSIINSIKSALLPYLCEVRSSLQQLKVRYLSSFKKIAFIIVPFVVFQSSLAPFYVPIVAGEKWKEAGAIPILMVVCLSAIPYAVAIFTDNLLISVDKPRITLYSNLIYTCLFALSILVAVQWGIFWVAVAVLACQVLLSPIYSLWSMRYIFQRGFK